MSYIHYLVPAPALHLPDRPALRRLADALFAGRWLVPSTDDKDHEPVVDQEDTPHLVGAPTAEELAELLAWPKNARASQDVDFERYEHAALKDTPADPLGVEDWHDDEDGYFGAYELAVVRHPHEMPHVVEVNAQIGDRFACASCGVETTTTPTDSEGPTFPLGARCGCGKRLEPGNLTQDGMDRTGFRGVRVEPLLWRFAITIAPEADPGEGLVPALDPAFVAAVSQALSIPMVERGQWG